MCKPAAILGIALLVGLTSACSSSDALHVNELPDGLIGTWRTEAPSHRDAFLRINPTTIAIGTMEGTVNWYSVDTIRRTRDQVGDLYTIDYHDPQGVSSTIAFYFEDSTLRLKNRPYMEWKWSRN